MAEDVGKVCTCIPYQEYHGEWLKEYNPECQVHSNHFYDPLWGGWVSRQNPHNAIIVEGEIEVCDTCRNVNGERVAWDQTWHALHKDKARQVQHCWRPAEPGSEELVPYCGDETAPRGMNLVTSDEHRAVPVCVTCHRRAMAAARKEEWDKATSEQAVNIFKKGWHIANRKGLPKTQFGLNRIRELLGR
ncbi:hypothetical protein PBI_TRISCUIT_96 [Microbacterium phage Triscuit]|nr:hypothetical protein PBI_TRISCUIT_96 [Microbacterium phage Triscuit]